MKLLALRCPECEGPLTPENNHIVSFCQRCNAAVYIGDEGINRIAVQYATPIAEAAIIRWRPFWIFQGKVHILNRKQQGLFSQRNKECEKLWDQVCRFYVPAWELPVKTAREIGISMLREQPIHQAIPQPADLEAITPVTVTVDDAVKLLKFFVLTIEAQREDKLKCLDFRLEVGGPELWALPGM